MTDDEVLEENKSSLTTKEIDLPAFAWPHHILEHPLFGIPDLSIEPQHSPRENEVDKVLEESYRGEAKKKFNIEFSYQLDRVHLPNNYHSKSYPICFHKHCYK